jgi:putative methyltransferase (TIGR04325 family)
MSSSAQLARAATRLPPNPLSRALYLRRFRRPFGDDNLYYGVYPDYATAQAAAEALSSRSLPASYDIEGAGRIYGDHLDKIRVSDYPLVYWLSRLIGAGARRIFDLGGNIGVSYYGFARYLDYPRDLEWRVHDLPHTRAAGEKHAKAHDARGLLRFAGSEAEADGHDVLVSTGTLQYLPYTLPELLGRLAHKPGHVLLNLTPMHAEREYFTLQNLCIAVCPYRILSAAALVQAMKASGYAEVDRWTSRERRLDIPFHPEAGLEGYSGFYFRRDSPADGRA